MSLNYDLTKIEDHVNVCYDLVDEGNDTFDMKAVTQAIIFATIPIDMGEITEENYLEFWLRYKLWAASYIGQPFGLGFTVEDIHDHIGLKVNVSTMTRHAWLTKRLSEFMDLHRADYNYTVMAERHKAAERHPSNQA